MIDDDEIVLDISSFSGTNAKVCHVFIYVSILVCQFIKNFPQRCENEDSSVIIYVQPGALVLEDGGKGPAQGHIHFLFGAIEKKGEDLSSSQYQYSPP